MLRDLEQMIEHAWAASPLPTLSLAISIVALLLASVGRRKGWASSKWLAHVGMAAPVAAFALTLADLAASHQRMLAMHGLVGSVTLPPPPEHLSNALAQEFSEARVLLLGPLMGLIMPIAAWVWGRVHWPDKAHRGLRWLAVLGASVVSISAWGMFDWATEFIYTGFHNYVDCGPRGWSDIDRSFVSLEQLRMRVIGAGVLIAVLASGYGVMQARQARSLRMEGWVALLAFVAFAGVAKLWTMDERRDTKAAFPGQANRYEQWPLLKGHADDPYEGPALDNCTFDWTGMNLLDLTPGYFDPERRANWGDWIDDCNNSEGIGPILAEPELPIGDVLPSLISAHAHGYGRFAVASVRPVLTDRATTGEFFRLQTCIVEFGVADDGVPLERFETWGELAEAADAAEGTLLIALPREPQALPSSSESLPRWRDDEDELVPLWAPFSALPDLEPEPQRPRRLRRKPSGEANNTSALH